MSRTTTFGVCMLRVGQNGMALAKPSYGASYGGQWSWKLVCVGFL
jgi:hypothetical protein